MRSLFSARKATSNSLCVAGSNGFKIKFPYLETIYICSRKNVFLRMIGKDTKIHNDAKKLAKNLGRSCVNLIPSKEKNEFISELTPAG